MSSRVRLITCQVLGFCIVLGSTAGGQIPQQQPKPVNPQGTIEAIGPGLVQIATAGNQFWMVRIPRNAVVSLTGTAEVGFLQPGMLVRFDAMIDRKGRVQEAVEKMTIISRREDTILNVFPKQALGGPDAFGAEEEPAKPNAAAGQPADYEVVGLLTGARKGKYMVKAGAATLKVELAEDIKIDVDIADYRFARKGDKITVQGFQMGENAAQARTMLIELSEPLGELQKKRPRRLKTPRTRRSKDQPAEQQTPDTAKKKPAEQEMPAERDDLTEKLVKLLTPKDENAAKTTVRITIKGKPMNFKPSVRGPAKTLARRFGKPEKIMLIDGATQPGGGQRKPIKLKLWIWGPLRLVVDADGKAKYFALVEDEQ